MFHAQKNNWQPSATFESLQHRAEIIANIRDFFQQRGVLEVETPLLSHATVTDPHVLGIPADTKMFLQTSPGICHEAFVSCRFWRDFSNL